MQNLIFLRGWEVFLSKIRHFSSSKTSVFGGVGGLFEKKNHMCAYTSSLESRLKELETEVEVVAAKSIEEKRFENRWRSTSRRSLRALVQRAGRQRAREAHFYAVRRKFGSRVRSTPHARLFLCQKLSVYRQALAQLRVD